MPQAPHPLVKIKAALESHDYEALATELDALQGCYAAMYLLEAIDGSPRGRDVALDELRQTWKHATSDELHRVVTGQVPDSVREHVSSCVWCRGRVEQEKTRLGIPA